MKLFTLEIARCEECPNFARNRFPQAHIAPLGFCLAMLEVEDAQRIWQRNEIPDSCPLPDVKEATDASK